MRWGRLWKTRNHFTSFISKNQSFIFILRRFCLLPRDTPAPTAVSTPWDHSQVHAGFDPDSLVLIRQISLRPAAVRNKHFLTFPAYRRTPAHTEPAFPSELVFTEPIPPQRHDWRIKTFPISAFLPPHDKSSDTGFLADHCAKWHVGPLIVLTCVALGCSTRSRSV